MHFEQRGFSVCAVYLYDFFNSPKVRCIFLKMIHNVTQFCGIDGVQTTWNSKSEWVRKGKREFLNSYYWFMNVSKDWLRCLEVSTWQTLAIFGPFQLLRVIDVILQNFRLCDSKRKSVNQLTLAWLGFTQCSSQQFQVVGHSTEEELMTVLTDIQCSTPCMLSTFSYHRYWQGFKLFAFKLIKKDLLSMSLTMITL